MKRIAVLSFTIVALVLGVGVGYAIAKMDAHDDSSNGHAGHKSTSAPQELGQDAFAAVAEIISILTNDPKTDWSKVDISALREHLVDMNAVFLRASVTQRKIENGIVFQVTGESRVRKAIQVMVPAHAAELDSMASWSADASTIDTGAILTVRSDKPEALFRIEGLGFFGLMATGAHHQPHHLQMATGNGHGH